MSIMLKTLVLGAYYNAAYDFGNTTLRAARLAFQACQHSSVHLAA